MRPWSGDHNFNPPDVPGMLFVNRKIEASNPNIMDIGPTVLDLFGVEVPSYCDGSSLMPAEPTREQEAVPRVAEPAARRAEAK